MRLWTLHPSHLDARGLVALWREALLAQKVLLGGTRGYRHHPQLLRFREGPAPVASIVAYLDAVAGEAEARGYAFDRSRIAADPGLGFGKTLAHNLALLAHTSLFHGLGVPLLIGASRKRFIQGVAGGSEPRSRDPGSHAAAIAAAAQGAQLLRVHDVAGTRQALGVWRAAIFGTES